MKKFLSSIFLVTFIIVGFTGQSWAFGSRHHHGGGQNGGGSGIGGNDQGSGSGSGGNGGNGQGSGSGSGGNGGNNFPAAPAPEPMTLSLLGTGLAGIFLKRKIR